MTTLPRDFRGLSAEDNPSDLRADTVKIGLALSGGGYRAAAFHLGTLAYLDRIQLLPNLERLSTISGGTFTGAKYILSLVDNHPFSKFFKGFYHFLDTVNLVERALTELSQGKVLVPSGQRKLITALANVYAKTFLARSKDGSKDASYTFGHILDADHIGVTEVAFNATEFRTGVAFRFQKTASKRAKIGNGNVFISHEDARKIRVADIVAASSCFPGGFEPLAFPQDFVWPNHTVPPTVKASIAIPPAQQPKYQCDRNNASQSPDLKDTVPLMDGGIYDNQGIESLLLADDRKNNGNLGLFIISDTSPTDENLFPYPAKSTSSGWLTLGQVSWIIYIFLVACILTVVSVVAGIWTEIAQGTFGLWKDFFTTLMPLLLSILVTVTLWYGRKLILTQVLARIPKIGVHSWRTLRTLKVNQLIYLISLRVESLFALIDQVFMKRIRSLIFEKVYADPLYQGKRITNRIDRLITRPIDVPGIMPVSDTLKAIITNAACMPTTLWFETPSAKTVSPESKTPNELDSLVIAGQATICFNLIQHIARRYGDDTQQYPAKIKALWNDLNTDWTTLNEKPCTLLQKRLSV